MRSIYMSDFNADTSKLHVKSKTAIRGGAEFKLSQ
jgi:hypothetical protein